MKKTIFLLQCILFLGTVLAQNLRIIETNTKQYPQIELRVYDRNPELWKDGEAQLKEAKQLIDSVEVQGKVAAQRKHKKVFVLFENSHFGSFNPQRDYFKRFLDEVLDTLSDDDKVYFAEFDWTLPGGNVLDPQKIYSGDKELIMQIVAELKKPSSNGKKHESTELNTAIMEALEFLNAIEEDAEYDKFVVLFSAEFSNIYNSIHTSESIIVSARQKNIPVYTVRYPRMSSKYNLKKIVKATFGEHMDINLSEDFQKQTQQFKLVLGRMNERAAGNEYVINYLTAMGPGQKAVGIEITKQDDPLSYETFFTTPSYFQYIMMDGTRKLIAIIALILAVLLVAGLVYFFIRKRKKERLKNDQKLQKIEEENRERQKEQDSRLNELKKEGEEKENKAKRIEENRLAENARLESIKRFQQIVRPPILVGPEGFQHQLSVRNILGRSQTEGCNIVINDPSVSRKHGCILFEQYSLDDIPQASNIFVYIDLGSANGSFINDWPVSQPVVLKNGDVIRLGAVHFTFRT